MKAKRNHPASPKRKSKKDMMKEGKPINVKGNQRDREGDNQSRQRQPKRIKLGGNSQKS